MNIETRIFQDLFYGNDRAFERIEKDGKNFFTNEERNALENFVKKYKEELSKGKEKKSDKKIMEDIHYNFREYNLKEELKWIEEYLSS